MVDEVVFLQEEQQVDIDVKGVAAAKATAMGKLIVDGIRFEGVLKVPGLGVNLISEGVLHSKGCDIISNAKEGWRKVMFQGRVLITASYEKGLFVWRPHENFLTEDYNYPLCMLASEQDRATEQQLWHLRLGHLNYADMGILKGMSEGMSFSTGSRHGMCVACCKGKMSARPFAGHNVKARKPFGVVYADLWGPVASSLQGNQYALLLVDEATTYTWVYCMNNKSQASDFISEFILQQDRQGNQVQTLRTDNGGEFISSKFKV
jgi:hypothetical protein